MYINFYPIMGEVLLKMLLGFILIMFFISFHFDNSLKSIIIPSIIVAILLNALGANPSHKSFLLPCNLSLE